MRTLIVEDNFTSRLLLRRLLAEYSECDVAVNGWEAIEAYKCALKSDHPYDLICLDILMPGLGGQESLRELRRLEAEANLDENKRVKIIIVTAVGDREQIEAAARGNCQAYLVKPIDKARLLSKLQALDLVKVNPQCES
ncbi:MAG: response regulator [Candidatus Coatesbacteria bacterium]|nr:response regulator [Candidatus Coatesbacteria bacterium]